MEARKPHTTREATPPETTPSDPTPTELAHFPDDINETHNPRQTHFEIDQTEEYKPPSEGRRAKRTIGASGVYDERGIIGAGGCGEVWDALQSSLRRIVAVKRLRDDVLARYSEGAEREALENILRHEAVTTSNLEHPSIVPVYDLMDEANGSPRFAMKKLRGRTWEKVIDEDANVLPVDQYLLKHLGVLMQVAQAVAFAHSRGVVHRDLKPSQVMVGDFGETMVMDWGLALVFDEQLFAAQAGPEALAVVAPGHVSNGPAGTLAYMAPEQMSSQQWIGPWTDVYLLGGCLYYLLALRPPHDDATKAGCVAKARKGVVNPLKVRAFEGEPPSILVDLIRRSLDPDPLMRPASAQEFLGDLQIYLSGQGRRAEAEALLDSAERRLRSPAGLDYHEFAGAVALLEQAAALAPGLPRAERLRLRLHEDFAEFALLHDDLRLAEFQAELLPEGPKRASLLDRVEQARTRMEYEANTRQQALVFSGVLVVLLVVAAVIVSAYAAKLRVDAQTFRERAASAASEADRAQGETGAVLEALLQQSLLEETTSAAASAAAYEILARRGAAPAGEQDAAGLAASRLALAAEVFQRSGELDRAKAALEQALAHLEADDRDGRAPELQERLEALKDPAAQSSETRGSGARGSDEAGGGSGGGALRPTP